ncbi:MAG: SRPBCC domain-containing protein [Mycobacteriales bacterium]
MTRAEINETTCSSDTVLIDAPAELVWKVVADFAAYGEWNPFCVAVDGKLELGAPVVLHTPDPGKPGELMQTREQISVLSPPSHLQYNTGDSIPGVYAVRDQIIEDLGNDRCSYRTVDVFTGEYAQLAYDLQGQWVTDGFNTLAYALKERAEKLWAGQPLGDKP